MPLANEVTSVVHVVLVSARGSTLNIIYGFRYHSGLDFGVFTLTKSEAILRQNKFVEASLKRQQSQLNNSIRIIE